MVTPTSVKAIVPAGLRATTYTLRACDATACSSEALINEPEVWWTQTDYPAADLVVAGGGHIYLTGRMVAVQLQPAACTSQTVQSTMIAALHVGDAGPLYRLPAVASCYHVDAVVPGDVPPGSYNLVLNSGVYAGNGLPMGTITVVAPPPQPTTTCTAATTSQLLACLTSLNATGGGTVVVAAGTLQMPANTALLVGDRVALVGAGTDATVLQWADNVPGQGTTPSALVTGAGAWSIANLTVQVRSAVEYAVRFDANCVGCSAIGVFIDVDTRGMPEVTPRNAFSAFQASHWLLEGSRVRMYGNCSASWPANTCYYVGASSDGIIRGNSWECGCQGYSHDSSVRLLVVNNTMISTGALSDGNGFSSFEAPYEMSRVYGADNVYIGNPEATKRFESWTFDGPGSWAAGNASNHSVNATGTAFLTLSPAVNSSMQHFSSGMLVAVMQGTGIGQTARAVASPAANVFELDAPLAVPPAADSFISVTGYKGQMVWERNTWLNGTTVQLFGTSIDVVFSGNTFTNMTAGLLGWGRTYQGGFQPSYRALFGGNTFACTTELSTFSSTDYPGQYITTGAFNLAHIHRNNTLLAGTNEFVRGQTWDTVVEGNVFGTGSCWDAGNGPQRPPGALTVTNDTTATFVRL